jgi:hypothetical protein
LVQSLPRTEQKTGKKKKKKRGIKPRSRDAEREAFAIAILCSDSACNAN